MLFMQGDNMPLRFLTRLTKEQKGFVGFYVPRYVIQFYKLKPGRFQGGVTLEDGATTYCALRLEGRGKKLYGKAPDTVGKPKMLAEVWFYRESREPVTK